MKSLKIAFLLVACLILIYVVCIFFIGSEEVSTENSTQPKMYEKKIQYGDMNLLAKKIVIIIKGLLK